MSHGHKQFVFNPEDLRELRKAHGYSKGAGMLQVGGLDPGAEQVAGLNKARARLANRFEKGLPTRKRDIERISKLMDRARKWLGEGPR